MRETLARLGRRIHTADRLTVLVVGLSLLLLALASFAAWRVHSLQAQSEKLLSTNVSSIRAVVELELHFQELRHQLDLYLLRLEAGKGGDRAERELEAIRSQRNSIDDWLAQAEATADTVEERSEIALVDQGVDAFYAELAKLGAPGLTDEARSEIARQAETTLEQRVLAPARDLLTIDEALLEASRQEAANQSRRLTQSLLFLGIFGAIAALAAGYSLARAISQSLLQLRLPIQDVAGKLSEVAGDLTISTTLDITDVGPALERLSKEVTSVVERLHSQQREIVHADQLATVGQLAAGIAHEIRNPLMAMKLLVQAARQSDSGQLDLRDLQILDEEIRRVEVLLADFLEFAKPKPLEKSLVDVCNLIESTASFLQRQADARKVVLECDLPAEPVLLNLDPHRIRQVLVNLMLNAIQATSARKKVRVCLDLDEGGEMPLCRITVSDEGPGIAPEQAGRIFEPFYSTKETGLGLGLAISQRIVRSHGGELSLDQAIGRGATLVIELPLAPTEASRNTGSTASA
jgi:two-component system, NtrC family, sensor histidine kinase HydH